MVLAQEYRVQKIKTNNYLYLPEVSFFFFKVRGHSLACDFEHLIADPDCFYDVLNMKKKKGPAEGSYPEWSHAGHNKLIEATISIMITQIEIQ